MQCEETQPLALNMEGNHEPGYVGTLVARKGKKWIYPSDSTENAGLPTPQF